MRVDGIILEKIIDSLNGLTTDGDLMYCHRSTDSAPGVWDCATSAIVIRRKDGIPASSDKKTVSTIISLWADLAGGATAGKIPVSGSFVKEWDGWHLASLEIGGVS